MKPTKVDVKPRKSLDVKVVADKASKSKSVNELREAVVELIAAVADLQNRVV